MQLNSNKSLEDFDGLAASLLLIEKTTLCLA